MPNDNIEAVRQHQMVVAWVRLRHMKKWKETYLIRTANCSCPKILIINNNKSNKNDINNDSNKNSKIHRDI